MLYKAEGILFQFPSNGKARVNKIVGLPKSHLQVSKFQFPSNGKARVNAWYLWRGKPSRLLFQFPSNGKARVNPDRTWGAGWVEILVSIPFKRESTCELRLRKMTVGI